MSKQKRTTRLVAAGIVACILAAAVLVYVNRSGSSAGSPLAFAAPVASLDEAVSRGMVGQNAVDALRADGSVDLVASFELPSFDAPGASPAAQATTDPQVSDLIDQLMAAYASVKQGAYGDVAGIEVLDELQALPNATLRVSDENALLALLSAPGVIGVSQPRTYDTLDNEGVPIVNADDTAAAGNVGAGTTVAVLDSGADYTNAAFGSCTAPNAPEGTCAVTFWKQYGTKQDEKLDESGHGTNVAGIVHAVAPGADILALDVFHPVLDENGQTKQSAEDTDILAALNDLILWKQQGTPIVSANMSLGSGGFSTEACTQQTNDDGTVEPNPYVSTFASMRQVGILPVVASGNDAGGGLLGTPEAGISSPACTPGAVSVGAVYVGAYEILEWSGCTDIVTHVDQVTCFSQTGPNLSMLAPRVADQRGRHHPKRYVASGSARRRGRRGPEGRRAERDDRPDRGCARQQRPRDRGHPHRHELLEASPGRPGGARCARRRHDHGRRHDRSDGRHGRCVHRLDGHDGRIRDGTAAVERNGRHRGHRLLPVGEQRRRCLHADLAADANIRGRDGRRDARPHLHLRGAGGRCGE